MPIPVRSSQKCIVESTKETAKAIMNNYHNMEEELKYNSGPIKTFLIVKELRRTFCFLPIQATLLVSPLSQCL
jgi:hypothetical protein